MKCLCWLTVTDKPIILGYILRKTPILMNSPRSHLPHVHRITSSGTRACAADIGKIPQRCSPETCIPQLLAEHFELFLAVWTCTKFFDILGEVRGDFYVNDIPLQETYRDFEAVQGQHSFEYKIVSSRAASRYLVW
jgi:hypothetical protein